MSFSTRDIALILSGDGNWLGTGTLVAPNRILTAYHVVFDCQGEPRENLAVRLEGESRAVPASVIWAGSMELDVAVLEAKIERKPLAHPLDVLFAGDVRTDTPWEARGYPAVRDQQPSTRMEQVRGKACSIVAGDVSLSLDVDVAPEKFNGLSGGAVIVNDRIVGIVKAVPHNWHGRRLEATPVSAFLNSPGFRKALGLDAQDDKLAKDLERRHGDITKQLQNKSELCAALAKKLGSPSTPASVAHGLLHAPAQDVAMHLADLDASPDVKPGDREVVRKLLWQALPLAIDWRDVLLVAHKNIDDGNTIALSLRTETMAEVVLAGVDGRACFLMDGRPFPQGVARVPMPSNAHAPLFNLNGDELVSAVVKHLCSEQEPALPAFAGFKGFRASDEELQYLIDAQLEDLARRDNPQRLPHYLLFIDQELRNHTSANLDQLWDMMNKSFATKLPNLRLVRLKGGAKEMVKESKVVVQVKKPLSSSAA